MSTRSLVFCSMFAFILPACGGTVGAGSADGADALGKADRAGTGHYYLVRHDNRECFAVGCGGEFIKRVGQSRTTCADGSSQSECYVGALDFSQTKLDDNERAAFAGKPIIVRGELVNRKQVTAGSSATLMVNEVWAPAVGAVAETGYAAVSDDLYRVVDKGLRCIAAPCLTYRETQLDSTHGANVAGVELSHVDAAEGVVADAYNALPTEGLIIDGHNEAVSGPAGKAQQLVASNFYRRVTHVEQQPTQKACGGFAGVVCGDGEFCDVTTPNACAAVDMQGVCKPVGDFCSQLYVPVCGCDGKTYANDCERLQARVQLAHEGACN